jgi:CBS domain containing-hemolysin-like protein
VLLVALIATSAFLSCSETALFSLSRAQLLRLREDGHAAGRAIAQMMRDPRQLLMVVLLGGELANTAFFGIWTLAVLSLRAQVNLGFWASAGLLVLQLFLVLLVGEVLPKSLAISVPMAVARLVALPLATLARVLGPLARVFTAVVIEPLTRLLLPPQKRSTLLTADELAALLEHSANRGQITPNESAWLREIIELSRVKVAHIMVPRVDMVAYDVDEPAAGLVELFRKTRRVKIPVYRGDLDNTLGVIHAKELLLEPETPLAELARPVPFAPEMGTVDKLLLSFRQNSAEMAIVVDEYGGTAGLVTLEDAVEEIVGELLAPDEAPPEPVKPIGPGEYLLSGDLSVNEWSDVFGVDLQAERISTIGGLAMSLLGRVPKVGDLVRTGNLEFTVESVARHRVQRLRVRLLEEVG